MRTHIPEDQKPHECKLCKKRFINLNLLNKHMLKHSGEKPFVCKVCNKGCYAENSLLKHMKIHEKKEGDPALLKHICDYCKTEFPDALTLSAHIKRHTGDRPFVCNTCGKCFPQRFNLELHLRTHTGMLLFIFVCQSSFEPLYAQTCLVSEYYINNHFKVKDHSNAKCVKTDMCRKLA